MIVVIAGATATGKSQLAVKLAKEFNGYILNGDSRQVYKELNIGTAKPSKEEIDASKVKHKLFGYVSIDEDCNLYRYQKDAFKVLEERENQNAFLVGGTGLYIDSVVHNYNLIGNGTNQRAKLEALSLNELQKRVGPKGMEGLNESDQKNPRRLIRLIERGEKNYQKGKPLEHIYLVLDVDFKIIEKNIRERIDTMFENGLLEENEVLLKEGKHEKINTIGYKEFRDFFEGKADLNEVKEKIFLNTRQYAKRQITWFKRNKNAIWIKDYKQAHTRLSKTLNPIY